jgi:hypothetical protein
MVFRMYLEVRGSKGVSPCHRCCSCWALVVGAGHCDDERAMVVQVHLLNIM